MAAGIPHHLIDILDPHEEFSAGDFHDRAHAAVTDILSRNKLPIVVGGTGFYLRMFIFGKSRGGAATADEEAEAVRLVEASVAARAAANGVARGDLEEGPAWEAGVQVLRDLGDEVGADRCASAWQTLAVP